MLDGMGMGRAAAAEVVVVDMLAIRVVVTLVTRAAVMLLMHRAMATLTRAMATLAIQAMATLAIQAIATLIPATATPQTQATATAATTPTAEDTTTQRKFPSQPIPPAPNRQQHSLTHLSTHRNAYEDAQAELYAQDEANAAMEQGFAATEDAIW